MRASLPTLVLLVGMSLQSAFGLLLNPYRDIAWIALSWLGNDAVTLLLVCPLLAAALTGTRPSQPRWQLARLGLLGYGIYNYAFYMLGAALNAMFPSYIALFVAAFVALISEFTSDRITRLANTYSPGTPVRLLGGTLPGLPCASRRCGWSCGDYMCSPIGLRPVHQRSSASSQRSI